MVTFDPFADEWYARVAREIGSSRRSLLNLIPRLLTEEESHLINRLRKMAGVYPTAKAESRDERLTGETSK
jgi:hypothetical protein